MRDAYEIALTAIGPTVRETERGSRARFESDAFADVPLFDQHRAVVFGAHLVLFSEDADADRAFLRRVLGFDSVDAGGGWLIFRLPPAELAVHPAQVPGAELYLICDDLAAEIRSLADLGVSCSEIEEARWGSVTRITLPGGGQVGLYQPRHPLALDKNG